jgi:CHAT domain-containing protein
VQSACETGLGENNIDGVWGLQRAFRIAGATRQIVSLLRVDDERTKEFMGELHMNISKSKDVYESYKTAQRYMYNKYKSTPRFWASFILLE